MLNSSDFIILKGILLRYKSTYPFVEVPEGVTCIGKEAFAFSDIETIVLPDTVTAIDEKAFFHCEQLREINLPEGLISIGDDAFSYCWNLTKISFPSELKEIGDDAFAHTSLEEIALPDELGAIGCGAFASTNIKEALIPEGISVINDRLFEYCSYLKKVILPEQLEEVGWRAFYYCKELEEINFPETLKAIDIEAFDGCGGIINENGFIIINHILANYRGEDRVIKIPEGVKAIGHRAFNKKLRIRKVIFPESLERIGEYAFSECKNLRDINIHSKVSDIAENAFKGCDRLSNDDGFIIINNVLQEYIGHSQKAVIPDDVEIIAENAFQGIRCTELEEIVMPETVHTIKDYAFYYCYNLRRIKLPENMVYIGDNAFSDCEKLESIMIPEGIEELGGWVLEDCWNLKEIILPKSLKRIGYGAINKCKSLEGLIIPEGVEEIRGDFLNENYLVNEIDIPESVVTLDNCDLRDIQLNIHKLGKTFKIIPKRRMDSADERLLWKMINKPSVETFEAIKTGAYKIALAERLYPEYEEYGQYLKKNIRKAVKDAVFFNDDELLESLKGTGFISQSKFVEYLKKAEDDISSYYKNKYDIAKNDLEDSSYMNIYYLKKIHKDLNRINKYIDAEDLLKVCNERIEKRDAEIKEREYKDGVKSMNEFGGRVPICLQNALKHFLKIRGYKDSDELIQECNKRLEEIQNESKEKAYQEAKTMLHEYDGNNRNKLESAIDKFEELSGYKDSEEILRDYYKEFWNIVI